MTDLVAVKRTRAAKAGWMTRMIKRCDTFTQKLNADKTQVDRVEFDDICADFDVKLEAWDEAQTATEALVKDEDLQTEIDEGADFREKCKDSKIKMIKAWNVAYPDIIVPTAGSTTQANVKLPKLTMKKFKKGVLEYFAFWEQFTVNVDENDDLADISKFSYLLNYTDGDARKAIEGLPVTAQHYVIAKKILADRWGRKEQAIFAHIQALLTLETPSSENDTSALHTFNDKLVSHIQCLEKLGVDGDQFGIVLTPIVLSRLPSAVRMEWARDSEGKEGDLTHLQDFIQKEINRHERSHIFDELSKSEPSKPEKVQKPKPAAAQLAQSSHVVHTSSSDSNNSAISCSFCDMAHESENCHTIKNLSSSQLEDKIKSKNICFICFARNHLSYGCLAKCKNCGKKHHMLLCRASTSSEEKRPRNKPSTGSDNHQRHSGGNTKKKEEKTTAAATESETVFTGTTQVSLHRTILPTAKVIIRGEKGETEAILLIDGGSDASYITSKLIQKISPKWVSSVESCSATFGGAKSSQKVKSVFELNLTGAKCSDYGELTLRAAEVPVICVPLSRPKFSVDIIENLNLDLADDYGLNRELNIDILVGNDFKWDILLDSIIRTELGPVAQNSKFGYILSGICHDMSNPTQFSGLQLLNLEDIPEAAIRSLWNLEALGLSPESETLGADPVMQQYLSSVWFDILEGLYDVCLPVKQNCPVLFDNYSLALKFMYAVNKRLSPEKRSRYDDSIREMEDLDIIEEVPSDELEFIINEEVVMELLEYVIHYLSQFPLFRESRTTTKCRPVYDASKKGRNGISLNDCLEAGPNLNPLVPDVLCRFRRWKVAISADVIKAFLCLKLNVKHRDCHRFLWEVDGRVRVMRFKRVTFGIKSSPFLLAATIRYHLSQCPPSVTVTELEDNCYVDDFLSGADSHSEAEALYSEAGKVMGSAGMKLAKWTSNESSIFGSDDANFHVEGEYTKVLGVKWLPSEDAFVFRGIDFPPSIVGTKRVLLSMWARFYEPLGLLSPFSVVIKFLFQEAWRLGLGWDEKLPPNLESEFQAWIGGLETLKKLKIPRRFVSVPWRDVGNVEIHCYADASTRGYGACAYIKVKTADGWETALVKSTSRIAPLKTITLPRLELLACSVAAIVVRYVIDVLRLPRDTPYTCWTDSMIAIGWIKGDPSRWKVFVANQVRNIQGKTDPSNWKHCIGKENPADLLTRGVSATALSESDLWFHGPPGLRDSSLCMNSDDSSIPSLLTDSSLVDEELSAPEIVLVSESSQFLPIVTDRWSTLNRAHRTLAFVVRFIRSLRYKVAIRKAGNRSRSKVRSVTKPELPMSGKLTLNELAAIKPVYLKMLQRSSFSTEISALEIGKSLKGSSLENLSAYLDSDGLLRIRGRLQLSDDLSYGSKHPVILPKNHGSELLIQFYHTNLNHAGIDSILTALRNDFWILGARVLVKKVKGKCVPCKIYDARPCNQILAPLPKVRVTQAPVFTVTGVDYAGPLYCIDYPGEKFYILLFVCGVVRAIHCELTESLDKDDCLLAIRRFAARKRTPSVVYSDNAKTFICVRAALAKYFGRLLAPEWKFIVPKGPWWGGWWERLVRSVKLSIKKTIGKRCLTKTELETTLCEVDACINSRPLTFVGDDVTNTSPLTPNDFLLGKNAGFDSKVLEDPENISTEVFGLREQERSRQLQKYWDVWRNDYVRNLPPSSNRFKPRGELLTGSVVLIREDKVPRMKWPMGKVVRLHLSKDGVPRSADLMTSKGMRTRPIQRLYDLEILDADVAKSKKTSADIVSGQASSTSGQASSTSGQASSISGQASSTSGQASSTSGQASSTSGQASSTSGQASSTSGQASSTSGQTSSTGKSRSDNNEIKSKTRSGRKFGLEVS